MEAPTQTPALHSESLHTMPELLKEGAEVHEVSIGDLTIEDALAKFKTTEGGLTEAEVAKRLVEYGPNALPEVHVNKCLQFFSFMWGPLPWVMEAASIVAIGVSNGPTP